jgi:5-(carboxyamino)imidazole ribonucleotide synthase
LSFPIVLKTRFGGYDGKGTRYARDREEWDALAAEVSKGGWLAEEFVPFKRELAVMVAIGPGGEKTFPTMETVQVNSVCDLVFPCDADGSSVALSAIKAMNGVGLFGVELFELHDGTILVNEIAPRPHNTGHYTLDWGGPSQFEFHIRTVMGLDMSQPVSDGFAVMVNLLGQPHPLEVLPAIRAALEVPHSFVHWYQKQEAKPGRKMGHINVSGRTGDSVHEVIEKARTSRNRFYVAWTGG